MRIAFIVNHFPTLSETFILNQVTGLLDRGHEVDIYTRNSQDEPVVHADVDKYQLRDRTYPLFLGDYGAARQLLYLIKAVLFVIKNIRRSWHVFRACLGRLSFKNILEPFRLLHMAVLFLEHGPYDVVHSHFGPNGQLALELKSLGAFEAKIITSFHGYDVSSYLISEGEGVYRDLFEKGDIFLTISQFMKKKLIKLGGDEKRILVHKVGIDLDRFSYIGQRANSNDKIRIITIGRLVEKKGISYGIRAVARVVEKHKEIEYLIIGDGPLKGDLERLINELDVGENVKLAGWKPQEEIMALLQKADLLLAPSVTSRNGDQEGIPVVLMEALACGLPVISTVHSGIPELVVDGQSGFLVAEQDVEALAKSVECLIENPKTRIQMGQAGRQFVEQHHNINALNNRLVEIYRQSRPWPIIQVKFS